MNYTDVMVKFFLISAVELIIVETIASMTTHVDRIWIDVCMVVCVTSFWMKPESLRMQDVNAHLVCTTLFFILLSYLPFHPFCVWNIFFSLMKCYTFALTWLLWNSWKNSEHLKHIKRTHYLVHWCLGYHSTWNWKHRIEDVNTWNMELFYKRHTTFPWEKWFDCTCICTLNEVFLFTGYQGTMCEIPDPRSACVHSQCQNGATCRLQGSLQDYVCECAAGFRGNWKIQPHPTPTPQKKEIK